MKKIVATLLGASLVCGLAACGGGGGAAIPDTPEGAAFEYRHGVMEALAYKVTRLRSMAMGEIPVSHGHIAKIGSPIGARYRQLDSG